jgi:hypothetical protein
MGIDNLETSDQGAPVSSAGASLAGSKDEKKDDKKVDTVGQITGT